MADEPTPPEKPKRAVTLKTVKGVWLPGKRPNDAKIRGYAAKGSIAVTLLGIVSLTVNALLGMIERTLTASSATQAKSVSQQAAMNGKLLSMQADMNREVLGRMDAIVSSNASTSASVAIVASRMGVMLDRARVTIAPANPGHTTIIVEPAPVTIVQQAPLAPFPIQVPVKPSPPVPRPRRME